MMSTAAGRRGSVLCRGALVSTLTLFVLGLILCGAEGVARLCHWGVDVTEPSYATELQFVTPCFHAEGSGAAQRLVLNPTTEPGWKPMTIPRAHQAAVTRIAVVGESNAAILGDLLRQRVERAPCGPHCEILSCGLAGASAGVVEGRVEEVLGYSPDAVVLIFGHNFRYSHSSPPALLRFMAGNPKARWLLKSRLVATLVLRQRGTVNTPNDSDDGAHASGHPESPSERSRVATQKIIRRIAERVRAAGSVLVISTLGANLLQPPATAASDQGGVDIVEGRFIDAVEGRAAAEHKLESLLAAAPSANVEFQLGLWRLAAGDAEGARRHLQRALELDDITPRAPAALNEFLRDLAHGEEIAVWDGEHIHQAAAPSRIPGWETFADCCHYTPMAADRTLSGLFGRTRQALHLQPCALASSPPTDSKRPWLFLRRGLDQNEVGETRRDWSLGIAAGLVRSLALDAALTDRSVHELLDSAAWKDAAPAQRMVTLDGIGWGYREAGRREEAYRINDLACALEGNAAAHAQRALWFLADGRRAEASAAIAQTAALQPTRPEIRRLVELFSTLGLERMGSRETARDRPLRSASVHVRRCTHCALTHSVSRTRYAAGCQAAFRRSALR